MPPEGRLPTPSGSSGLDDDDDSGIGLNTSVVESAASGTLLTTVALSASSSPLSSFSPSATKRMQRFFLLSINQSADTVSTVDELIADTLYDNDNNDNDVYFTLVTRTVE